MRAKTAIWLTTIAVIVLVYAGWQYWTWSTWSAPWTMHGKTYDVTVTVFRVEQSERLYDHTYVYVTTTWGETQSRYYLLYGHHNFEIGKTYRFVFEDRIIWLPFPMLKLITAGEVVSIKEIPG